MASIETVSKAKALSLVLGQLTGATPVITNYQNYSELNWNPTQQKMIAQKIENELNKKRNPSDVKVNIAPVVVPLVIKKALPFVAVGFGVAFVAGYFTGRKK